MHDLKDVDNLGCAFFHDTPDSEGDAVNFVFGSSK